MQPNIKKEPNMTSQTNMTKSNKSYLMEPNMTDQDKHVTEPNMTDQDKHVTELNMTDQDKEVNENSSHCFDVNLAAEYSVEEAILIYHFQRCIGFSAATNTDYFDGRTWIRQTQNEIGSIFTYFTRYQISKILNRLVKNNVILKGNYNEAGNDRTTWYAFIDEERFGIEPIRSKYIDNLFSALMDDKK
jgi:hypothetical protein